MALLTFGSENADLLRALTRIAATHYGDFRFELRLSYGGQISFRRFPALRP